MQKKEKILGEAAGAAGVAGDGALGPGAAPITLGLFLLPGGRPGRRLTGAADDDPAVAGVVLFLFLLPRGRPRPRGATGEPNENHLRQPCGKGRRLETLDGARR
jgi:hypothetical protein